MVKLGKPKSTSMRINTVFESSFGLRGITVFSAVIGFYLMPLEETKKRECKKYKETRKEKI